MARNGAEPEGVRMALKAATEACHARLERRLSPSRMTSSRQAYRHVLSAFYGFYAPLEVELARADLPEAARGPSALSALRADLLALGVSRAELCRLPRCARLPALRARPEALGCAYVLEGAALGGQVIAREARARLGVTPASGGRFFHGEGAATGARWRAFVRVLERSVRAHEQARAATAARATFEALEAWLTERGARP